MSHDRYNDPYYDRGNRQQPDYSAYPANQDAYNASYDEQLRYPSFPNDDAEGYQPNPSTEKMVGDDHMGTERVQRGRQNIGGAPTKSWAEMGPPPRSTGILRMWRKDERGKQWTRGGGVRSTLRLACCCITISLVLIISIVLAILLYVHPPSVLLDSINLGSNPVSLTTSGLTLNVDLQLTVANPNWFGVDFKEISANAKYGSTGINFGGGTLYNVNFAGYTESQFDFPFSLNYSTAADPNKVILNDLVSKCGVTGGSSSDITIKYDLNLKLKVLGVSVNPTVSNSASFECPISASDLEGITGGSA